jgi:hypothetical protein
MPPVRGWNNPFPTDVRSVQDYLKQHPSLPSLRALATNRRTNNTLPLSDEALIELAVLADCALSARLIGSLEVSDKCLLWVRRANAAHAESECLHTL